jgi:hypothetical protein
LWLNGRGTRKYTKIKGKEKDPGLATQPGQPTKTKHYDISKKHCISKKVFLRGDGLEPTIDSCNR